MTLAFLLDEHLSPAIIRQIRDKRPEITVESVLTWQNGQYCETDDALILRASRDAGLSLVTYDRRTITPVLEQWGTENESHAGVIFVSHRTIPSQNIGALVRALIALWDSSQSDDWTDRVEFLRPA